MLRKRFQGQQSARQIVIAMSNDMRSMARLTAAKQ